MVRETLNKMVEKLNYVPNGYSKTIGATTAPKGYEWYNNGESRFSGKRNIILIKKQEDTK